MESETFGGRGRIVIQGLKPYPEMKDSGIEWLGEVPAHWDSERAKWLFQRMERPVREEDEVVTCFRDGVVTLRKNRRELGFTESIKEIGYQGIRVGDLVIHSMDAFAGAIGIADSNGKGTPVYSVCKPGSQVNVYFYAYILREMARRRWIQALAKGIRERSSDFKYTDFACQLVPRPSTSEQAAIVRFLDHADGRIRRYIEAMEKLISLLEEQKQAIIHQAVTGQIDVRTGKPYPAYKPSEVGWSGDVPEHWEVRRLKTLCSMKSGVVLPQNQSKSDGKYPVYGGNGLRGFTSKYTHCGDFALIGRQGALCGNVHIARGQFYASEHAVVCHLNPGYVLEWFVPVLGEMDLNRYSIAAAQPGLAVERILNLSLPVPPSGEQASIATFIERQSGDIDNSISKMRRQIDLMQEYRTRLIADVVTGKVDVRGIVDKLPDMDSIAAPDVDSTVHDGPGIRDENRCYVRV